MNAVNQAHLAVEETVFEPLATSYAAVSAEDRDARRGGGGYRLQSSGMVVYYGDALLLARHRHARRATISRAMWRVGLCLSYDDAERLKLEYGCALLGLTCR